MFILLDRFYEIAQRYPVLYPAFLAFKLAAYIFPLIKHEGLGGAAKWLYFRFIFVTRNWRLLTDPKLPDQSINVFASRHGFTLSCWIEYVVYDEIFLEGIYGFAPLRSALQTQPDGIVLDFGVHHGMFVNYVQSLNPTIKVFGAELNPKSYARAKARFEGMDNVILSNVGIGGVARSVSIQLAAISPSQSIYSSGGLETADVKVITPTAFVASQHIESREILLMKMDIEGTETEVFENFNSIKDVLKSTRLFVVEIHNSVDVRMIANCLLSVGLILHGRKQTTFLYVRQN